MNIKLAGLAESNTILTEVLNDFGIVAGKDSILPLQQGLINNTWKVGANGQAYILQRINQEVFKNPEDVDFNISSIAQYLSKHHPGYLFTAPVRTNDGRSLIKKSDANYYRVFPFVPGSHTKTTVETPEQAYEAAKQFGKFTDVLHGFDSKRLKVTITGFHDLSLRYRQFHDAMGAGDPERIRESSELILQLKDWSYIVEEYERIRNNPEFKVRVIHHDTKISNVLFGKDDKGICVIDLDTIMPGYFISDVGDMMRTYLSPVSEEEKDMDKVGVRPEIYHAIVDGYMSEMKNELTETEKQYFFYAGTFMIYMQALRFLTDYLNMDKYYRAAYPGQNKLRAQNQLVLLQGLLQLKSVLR